MTITPQRLPLTLALVTGAALLGVLAAGFALAPGRRQAPKPSDPGLG